jgi:uncharacterized protein (TIGR02453 family)
MGGTENMGATRRKIKETAFHLPKEAIAFFKGLEANNSKAWFDAHRDDYQNNVLEPLKFLVMALGAAFSRKIPGLVADPRVNGSIFRVNRDTRFSRDKNPYKTQAGAYLWIGPGEKLACPGLYFEIGPRHVSLGSGTYMFADSAISAYRRYVAEKGNKLAGAIRKATTAGFELGGEKLKRVPSGFDPAHKHAELLKHKGLYVMKTLPTKTVTSGDLAGWLTAEFTKTLEVLKVLKEATVSG